MKKERNCMNPYPVYTPYQGIPFQYPMNQVSPFQNYNQMPTPSYLNESNNSIQDQINNLSEQVNLLDKRLTNLETTITKNTTSNNYSSSNYQMM